MLIDEISPVLSSRNVLFDLQAQIFILRAYTAPALVYLGRSIYDMFSLLLIDLVFRS